MSDTHDVSVNENGEPLGITPDTPRPAGQGADSPDSDNYQPVPGETPMELAPATPQSPSEPWPSPAVPEPIVVEPIAGFAEPSVPAEPAPVAMPPEPAPTERLTFEAPQVVAPAVAASGIESGLAGPAPGDDLADGLTGQLRALSETLDEPAGEAVPETVAEAGEVVAVATAAEAGEEPAGAAGAAEGEVAPEGTPAAQSEEGADSQLGEDATVAEGSEATTTDSLDDIAPGTVGAVGYEQEAAAVLGEVEAPLTTVSWWPFVGYVVVWLGAAAYAVWQLQQIPQGMAAYETAFYTMTVLVGLSLLAIGPVLLVIVWLASWIGRKGARIGSMFISALLKGALATMIGAVIWIGALLLIDYLRLGRPF